MLQMNRNDYTYTPLFCEENIWKLIESLYTNKLAKPIDVLFILNDSNTIALYNQKLSYKDQPVIWDYHVILVAKNDIDTWVFDFDSRCKFPIEINDYFSLSFPCQLSLPENFQPLIKSIPAEKYFKLFYSDRHHMLGVIKNCNFPNYEIIKPKNIKDALALEDCRISNTTKNPTKLILPSQYLRLNNFI